jgi:hypothetical protein
MAQPASITQSNTAQSSALARTAAIKRLKPDLSTGSIPWRGDGFGAEERR